MLQRFPSRPRAALVVRLLALALVGSAVGLAASVVATRALEARFFGVRPGDPLTLAAVTVLLAAVALAASWAPARRAARVDPARVLQQE